MSSVRWAVSTAAAAVLCVSLAGCTGPGDTPATTTTPSASVSVTPSASASAVPSPTPVTLRFGVYGEPAALTAYRRLARSYTAEHPEITIDVVVAASKQQAMDELITSTAGDATPDVFVAGHDDVPALLEAKVVQPVNELLEDRGVQFGDNYQRNGLEAFSADSALQCMPQDVSPLVVYYNADLLDLSQFNEPGEESPSAVDGWTWEQFTRAAKRMSHDGVKGLYLEPNLDTLMTLVRSAGADVVDDPRTPTTLTMADGDTRSALEQILMLARDPQVTPTRQQLAKQDAITRFEKGRIGMLFANRSLTPRLRKVARFHFDVLPLPKITRFSTLASMSGYCLSATTEHTDAAADFLTYAVGLEGAKIVTEAGGVVPSNIEIEHSDAFLQPGREPEHAAVFSESVRRSNTTPFVTGWAPLEAAVQPIINRLFYDPVIDLDVLLPRLDKRSLPYLSPPSPSPSP